MVQAELLDPSFGGHFWPFLLQVFSQRVCSKRTPHVQDPDKLQRELLRRQLTETARTGSLAGGAAGADALRQQQEQNALFRADRPPTSSWASQKLTQRSHLNAVKVCF